MSIPSIACIGIIGKHVSIPIIVPTARRLADADFNQDNPLHISLFPPYEAKKSALLDFSFLLNASLDIFDARCRDRNRVDQDLGMLQVIDERLSIWGRQTGTGARFAIIVDTWGKEGKPVVERKGTGEGKGGRSVAGRSVQDADVRSVSRQPSILTDYRRCSGKATDITTRLSRLCKRHTVGCSRTHSTPLMIIHQWL